MLSTKKPREQSGRDSFGRFRAQCRSAAIAALSILEDKEIDRVYCDLHDDFVVRKLDENGYPSVFRNEIYERCSHVVLKVKIGNINLSIKRIYSRDVDIEVSEPNNLKQYFYNESEYSAYLFDLLNIDYPNLVSTRNQSVTPYLATMLPIFYVDQDEGYSKIYSSPSNFIKDQFSEMARLLFSLPPKNHFDKKRERILAKEKLDSLDKKVEIHSRRLEEAQKSTKDISKSSEEIRSEISNLEKDLDGLKNHGLTQDEPIKILERLISNKISDIRDIDNQVSSMNMRSKSVKKIIDEINTEIETLNLNEEARRVFLSIDEICGSASCQLFSPSSDSYSKNLLYLKDQIKDLERNDSKNQERVIILGEKKKALEGEVQELSKERNQAIENSDISSVIDAISELKSTIFDLQGQLDEINTLEAIERTHLQLILDRDKACERYDSFSSEQVRIPEIQRLRARLRQLYIIWLDKIHTSNISHDITFRDDFVPILGTETIPQLKGSTKSRAILAYHAALVQLLGENESLAFKFLILDTPKQHETHVNDLDRYMLELKSLCARLDVQVIFSTTEYHYNGDTMDVEWNPEYPGEEQNMFLKKGN